jgi:hypothetical protein
MSKSIDLTGQVFGRLTAISRCGKSSNGTALWMCRCACGNTHVAKSECLRTGSTSRCTNCLGSERVINLAGHLFGQLLVLCPVRYDKKGYSMKWLCLCTCGAHHIVRSDNLRRGHTKRCANCQSLPAHCGRFRHGMSGTPTYVSWYSMIYRCGNPKYSEYKYYGGRGIQVCDRWLDFDNFFLDMGERPEGHTIDRIDVDGDYCPENCRWATPKEQTQNRRTNKQSEVL